MKVTLGNKSFAKLAASVSSILIELSKPVATGRNKFMLLYVPPEFITPNDGFYMKLVTIVELFL